MSSGGLSKTFPRTRWVNSAFSLTVTSGLALASGCSGEDDNDTLDDFQMGSGAAPMGASDGFGGEGGSSLGGTGADDAQGSGGSDDLPPLKPSMGPCREVVCGAGQECVIGADGEAAMCRCKVGFTGPTCEDIDECLNGNPCDEQGTCFNYPGGFFCECTSGYRGDGRFCENVDECEESSDSCDHDAGCSDSDGAYGCTCGDGESGDGLLCQAADACESAPCGSGTCLSTSEGFVCDCQAGSAGATCEQSCGDLSVADAHLEFAIRELLGLGPTDAITQEVMSGFTRLSLPDQGVTSLDGLECWPGLESLNVSDNEISDLGSMAKLTHLKSLNVSCNPFTDFAAVSDLVGLRTLEVRACADGPKLENADISALSGLRNLRELWLTGLGLSDVSQLSSLKEMRTLELGDNLLSSSAAWEEMSHLRVLGVSGNRLKSLGELGQLKSLVSVSASRNLIEDVTGLEGAGALNRLYLDRNQLTEIEVLAGLSSLRLVHLNSNQISDVSPLSALTELAQVKLNNNDIEDLTPFAAALSFQPDWELDLRDNPISCGDQTSQLDTLVLRGITTYVSCK